MNIYEALNYLKEIEIEDGNGKREYNYYDYKEIEPMITVIVTEIIANYISGELPGSLLNAFGNWLQLVGQVIQLYISQEQLNQLGPGFGGDLSEFFDLQKYGKGKSTKRGKRLKKKR